MRVSITSFCLLAAVLFLSVFAPAESDCQEEQEKDTGVVRVYTRPAGASVYIDGVVAENLTPVELDTEPGAHEIKVVREGYEEQTRMITVEAGRIETVRFLLDPLPEYEAKDRSESFQGGYVLFGLNYYYTITSDMMLGDSLGSEVAYDEYFDEDGGINIQFRYVHPLDEWGFLVVDTGYSDVRMTAGNVDFKGGIGKTDDVDLMLIRGNLDFSIAPNLVDYLLPYVGGGFHYTDVQDLDDTDRLGSDGQETFIGYTAKAGLMWSSRRHLVVGAEYQYHWAYKLEDYTVTGYLGYQF